MKEYVQMRNGSELSVGHSIDSLKGCRALSLIVSDFPQIFLNVFTSLISTLLAETHE